MDDDRIRSLERDLWFGGEDVYRQRIDEECLMVIPQAPFVMTGEEAIKAIAGSPRWTEVDLEDLRISRPEEGLIVIAYRASARRDDQAYRAWCSTTYRRLDHEDWRVVQHQQTPESEGNG